MSKKKRVIAVVVTSRASYARIKSVLTAIESHPDLELKLILGASTLLDRYGSAVKIIEADGFEPAAKVFMVIEGENPISMAKTTGVGILELATIFDNMHPDIVLTVADRYETLATAVSASYMNIPVAHVQGGEITGSIDDKVRHAITKLSNYHLLISPISHSSLILRSEGGRTRRAQYVERLKSSTRHMGSTPK